MKRLGLFLPALALAACAPSMAMKPVVYTSSSSALLAAVAEACQQVPPAMTYNTLSVTDATPSRVTCVADQQGYAPADPTTDYATRDFIGLTFTARQTGGATSLAVVEDGPGDGSGLVVAIFAILDMEFQRSNTP